MNWTFDVQWKAAQKISLSVEAFWHDMCERKVTNSIECSWNHLQVTPDSTIETFFNAISFCVQIFNWLKLTWNSDDKKLLFDVLTRIHSSENGEKWLDLWIFMFFYLSSKIAHTSVIRWRDWKIAVIQKTLSKKNLLVHKLKNTNSAIFRASLLRSTQPNAILHSSTRYREHWKNWKNCFW